MKRSTKITLSVVALIGLALYMAYRWIACIDMGGTGQYKPDFCYNKPNWFERLQAKRETMNNIEEIKRNLEFTCVREQRPPLSEETQQLYNYALHRDLNHMWPGERGDGFWDNLLPYYRIAAANGDYKANVRLQFILSDGWTQVPEIEAEIEVHQLNKQLQKQLPATAYYLLKGYIEDGYGVSAPPDSELAFLRKAADMGSRDAQFVLGKTLMGIDDKETLQFRLKLKRKLYRCASEQGQGDASEWLGIDLQNIKQYPEAVAAYYQGVKNGNSQAAFSLAKGFEYKEYLNMTPDAERARR
ncbi:tetratricopeptide repeat protein, partial [Neisseria dumasiana]